MTFEDFSQISNAKDVGKLVDFLQDIGFEHILWQLRSPEFLYSWERMPSGFLEKYYESQLNQTCAIAEAIRQWWQVFTFLEACLHFSDDPKFKEAEVFWKSYGIKDGVVYFSGRCNDESSLVLFSKQEVAPILRKWGPHLAVVSWKFHELLLGSPELKRISRTVVELSPKQAEVLRLNIRHPEMTMVEQAEYLQISPRMLEKRHKQIARKYGVSNFASAIAKAIKS